MKFVYSMTSICNYVASELFFWIESRAASPVAGAGAAAADGTTFFSSMASSTLSTVRLKVVIVSPWRFRMRGSHPSGRRSSMRMVSRSRIRPPNIVSIVDELKRDNQDDPQDETKKRHTWNSRIFCGRCSEKTQDSQLWLLHGVLPICVIDQRA